jgi:hypothetical protein
MTEHIVSAQLRTSRTTVFDAAKGGLWETEL